MEKLIQVLEFTENAKATHAHGPVEKQYAVTASPCGNAWEV